MDEFRKNKPDNIDDYPELLACDSKEPESIIDEIAIEAALDLLPDELKEIVVMRYVSDMIDKHFDTQYNDCDYNICHFVSGAIRDHRFYEVCY